MFSSSLGLSIPYLHDHFHLKGDPERQHVGANSRPRMTSSVAQHLHKQVGHPVDDLRLFIIVRRAADKGLYLDDLLQSVPVSAQLTLQDRQQVDTGQPA